MDLPLKRYLRGNSATFPGYGPMVCNIFLLPKIQELPNIAAITRDISVSGVLFRPQTASTINTAGGVDADYHHLPRQLLSREIRR